MEIEQLYGSVKLPETFEKQASAHYIKAFDDLSCLIAVILFTEQKMQQ